MNKLVIAIISLIFSFAANAAGTDLKAYMTTGVGYLEASNVGWKIGNNNGPACKAMKSVGLGCTYNHRVALVDFLTKNGKAMFPCEGNTNPYYNAKKPVGVVGNCAGMGDSSNVYIGQSIQNKMLAVAIAKNKALFSKGNLTADNAKKWQI